MSRWFGISKKLLLLRMTSSNTLQLSEKEIALSLARKQKREARNTPSSVLEGQNTLARSKILDREWATVREVLPDDDTTGFKVKLMTWNMLAQCLVRRDLFPTSDCLKANQREGMILNELSKYEPDIFCLQEVDRVEKLLPTLHGAGYSDVYATGPGKRHGCMIAYSNKSFEALQQSLVEYDNIAVRDVSTNIGHKGSSRQTRNIGLIVGLRRRDQPTHGYIVATTHLFWHPSFTYERTRQAALLLQEVTNYQERHDLRHWPCLIAGDFNFTPADPTYAFLVGDMVTSQQLHSIDVSRVVHRSIDPTVEPTPTPKDDEEGSTAERDPDRIITNARPATVEDGLISNDDFCDIFKSFGSLRSVYHDALRSIPNEDDNVFGARTSNMTASRQGYFEPMWTSYTHFWKATLDYIFILENGYSRSDVLKILKLPRKADLGEGLPLKGVCGSDHISLVAEIRTVIIEQRR